MKRSALLAVLLISFASLLAVPVRGDQYVAGGTAVARTSFTGTAADNGQGVQCTDGTGSGGVCIAWSSAPPGDAIEVVDQALDHAVAFQVCVDNDGNGACGGAPLVPGCEDDIAFSHFDDGRFSNPLGGLPTSFRAGCPGGFPGWVVILCNGVHAPGGVGALPHTHTATAGSVSVVASGGPSGDFCNAPRVPGKPYQYRGSLGTYGLVTVTPDGTRVGGIRIAGPLPDGTCDPTQAVHVVVAPALVGGAAFSAGETDAVDTCLDPVHYPAGDGDPDLGVSSGVFPSRGNAACLPPGVVGHHADGTGAAYHATNGQGLPLVWFAATDGPISALDPCVGDGVIGGDPATENTDCASGQMGVWDGSSEVQPATLAPNFAGADPLGDCVPANGKVVVTAPAGAFNGPDGSAILSVPPGGTLTG